MDLRIVMTFVKSNDEVSHGHFVAKYIKLATVFAYFFWQLFSTGSKVNVLTIPSALRIACCRHKTAYDLLHRERAVSKKAMTSSK